MSSDSKTSKKKRLVRHILMAVGILAAGLGGGWFYLKSGRVVSTDNAYVKAAKVMVAPEVSGAITSVSVADNQWVDKGSVLFTVDDTAYRIALARAEADFAEARAQIEAKKGEYRQKLEDIDKAQVDVAYYTKEYDRQVKLKAQDTVSQSKLDEIKRARDSARKDVLSLKEELSQIMAALGGNPDIDPDDHPLVKAAAAALAKAKLDMQRTTVCAPADGTVGTAPAVGEYAHASVPMINIVSNHKVWIEANFKETDLENVKLGQKVKVTIDTYPGHVWRGTVESISPATGAEFSILPAQNTTGNWVKVVQRITVRIAFEDDDPDLVKRAGMSADVSIDTGVYPHLPDGWSL